MIRKLLDAITHRIMEVEPRFTKGIALGWIDLNGRVMTQTTPNENEFQWAGISDTSENYFYIRHRDSGIIGFEQVESKSLAACGGPTHQLARYEFKVVGCIRNGHPYSMEEGIRRGIVTAQFPAINGVSGIAGIPISSNINSMGVVEEEIPKKKTFDKNLIFVSVDFDLTMKITYF